MEHALVLRGKCVRANMRWNLGQTVPARAGDPTADRSRVTAEQVDKYPPKEKERIRPCVEESRRPSAEQKEEKRDEGGAESGSHSLRKTRKSRDLEGDGIKQSSIASGSTLRSLG
jgi:hypothetical protein